MLRNNTHMLHIHTHIHNSPYDQQTITVMQMLHTQAGEGGCDEKLVTCLSMKTHEAPEAVLTISHRQYYKKRRNNTRDCSTNTIDLL